MKINAELVLRDAEVVGLVPYDNAVGIRFEDGSGSKARVVIDEITLRRAIAVLDAERSRRETEVIPCP